MDTPPPHALSEALLVAALADEWDISTATLTYVPKGAGGYHWKVDRGEECWFLTVDDLGTKPWIAEGLDATFDGLTRAYNSVSTLEERDLPMAVGAVRSCQGKGLVRLSARYGAALFPYIEGLAGSWGEHLDVSAQAELVRGLAQLHSVPKYDLDILEWPLELRVRAELDTAIASLEQTWIGGPYSERAHQALSGAVPRVLGWLGELEDLAREIAASKSRTVVTHGEPHPGNVIRSGGRLRLVDWDTVATAPPERDLWMFHGSPELFDLYEDLTGRRVGTRALRYFSLAWALSDIASFAEYFRGPHEVTQRASAHLASYFDLLAGGTPAPYGV